MAKSKLDVFKKAAKLYNASAACRDTDPALSRKLSDQSRAERAKLSPKPLKAKLKVKAKGKGTK